MAGLCWPRPDLEALTFRLGSPEPGERVKLTGGLKNESEQFRLGVGHGRSDLKGGWSGPGGRVGFGYAVGLLDRSEGDWPPIEQGNRVEGESDRQ